MSDRQASSGTVGPHLWQIQWVRDVAVIVAAVFLIWFGYYLRGIFTPVVIALFLAYLFDPLITFAERKGMRRPMTIAALLGVLAIVVMAVVLWLGPVIVSEAAAFISNLPGYAEAIADRLRDYFNIDPVAVRQALEQRVAAWRDNPGPVLARAAGWALAGGDAVVQVVGGAVGTAAFIGFMLLLVPFYFFFFAWHFGPMVRSIENYLPRSSKQRTLHILGRMNNVVASYFRERVIICLIMAAMFSIGWWLAGVPYALLLGLAAGLLSLIPYVGMVVWPVAVLMAYLSATSGPDAAGFGWMAVIVWPTVVFAVVQFVEGWILTPVIQGKSMEMSSVTILLVVFIGGAVGGLYGMILCIPVAACLKILDGEVVLPRLRQWAAEN